MKDIIYIFQKALTTQMKPLTETVWSKAAGILNIIWA